jgi:uncharacterized protein involved in exopolysaccharide biosynthesis
MNNEQVNATSDPEELSLFDLVRILWADRKLIVLVTVLGLIAGVSFALLSRPWYRVSVVMLPITSNGAEGALGRLGGLASLAGVVGLDLGGSKDSKEAMAVLTSKGFARDFIQDNDLLSVLLAKKWDSEKKAWRETDVRKQPDIRDAVQYFDKYVRRVSEDKKTGLVTLSVEWTDPILAEQWATSLVERLNAQMRKQALEEGERNVDFLRKEMTNTNLTSLQQSLGKILESEMQKLLLARGNEEFSFKVIDPAVVPKKPYKPAPVMMALGGMMMGLVLSSLFVFVRASWHLQTRSK